MPVDGWRAEYAALLDAAAAELSGVAGLDLTVECITHRFTPNSKDVLTGWYPRTKLEMEPELRSRKRGKFGAVKYVYPPDEMRTLRAWFGEELERRLPAARLLYWT
jgi:spore photoproduct lyase